MLRRLRETVPVVLVPLAWAFATAAHLGVLGTRAVLIGHLVMDVVLFGFAALSWRDMRTHPVLRAWLAVIVVGFFLTGAGTYALATGGGPVLLRGTVLGWLALPAGALVYTGTELPAGEWSRVYTVGGLLSTLGAALFLAAPFAGPPSTVVALALAGVGQTAGIVAAVVRY